MGSVAFVRYYLDLINETAVHPKGGVLELFATSSCKSCDNYESTVQGLVAKQRKFSGPELTIKRVINIGLLRSTANVEAHVRELPVEILEANGDVAKKFSGREDDGVVFELNWQRGWKVAAVRPMSE